MELYFARYGLSTGRSIDIPLLQVRAVDAFHWLENRGFDITREELTYFGVYDEIKRSLARYGVIPLSDIVADINLEKHGHRKVSLNLELASTSKDMINEISCGIVLAKPKLLVKQSPYKVNVEGVNGHFKRLEHENENKDVRIFSVAQLRDFISC